MISFLFKSVLFPCTAALILLGCSGTIQRESTGGSRAIEGLKYQTVELKLTENARKLQADNIQFSQRELSEFIRRRLEASDLLVPSAVHRVEVTIDSFRVRSAFAAVLLGIMAGTDSITGYVRIYDNRNRQLHGFKVDTTYGLGGWAGGQDGTRMSWLYEKFSELVVAELSGNSNAKEVTSGRATVPAAISQSAPTIISASAAASNPMPAAAIAPVARPEARPEVAAALRKNNPPTQFAALDNVDALPLQSDRARAAYKEWLTKKIPKVFVITSQERWISFWGTNPANANMPQDPLERVEYRCNQPNTGTCKIYAIDNDVVWKP